MDEKAQKVFVYKLDIYYQAIAIYAATLVVYGAVLILTQHTMDFVLRDQVVYLLAICIIVSAVGLLINGISRRTVIIEHDEIIITSRFHRRTIPVSDIIWIRIGREKRMKVRGSYKVAKIKMRGRRRLLRLHTSLFSPEHDLIESLRGINQRMHPQGHRTA